MALVLKDRVKETSTTAGTGTLTLAGAVSGFQSFAAVGNGNTTYYAIADSITGDWEVGIGTYTSSGTTLSRTTVLSSSNGGSLVSFAANPKDVFVTYPSEKSVYEDAAGVVVQQSFGAITATSAALTTGTITTAPVSNTDIVNKQYADAIASGIHFHEAVNLATTAALPANTYNNGASGVGATLTGNANGALSVDSTLTTASERILVKNEAAGANNGVYTVTQVGSAGTPYILTRATDFDSVGTGVNEIDEGDFFLVTSGTANVNTAWVQQTPPPITIGTTALVFQQFSAPITYTAGTGLNESPTYTFNIATTGVTATTYGSASQVPVFAVNAQGQLTSVTNTAIAINGSAVSGNITGSAGSVANALTLGTYLTGTSYNGSSAVTAAVDATSTNTVSKVVARDSSGNFAAGTITAALSGNASTATAATNIAGGAANQIPYQTGAATTSFIVAPTTAGTYLNWTGSAFAYSAISTPASVTFNNSGSGDASGTSFNGSTARTISYNTVGAPSTGGTGATGTWGISISGNAATATSATSASTATFATTAGSVTGQANSATITAATANTASTIVLRDASGNFSAGTITAALNGNASTATTAANVNNGTLTMNVSGTGLSGSQTFTANQASAATFTVSSNATNLNTGSAIVARDASGNFSAGTITATLSGNASTATSATTAGSITSQANSATITASSSNTANQIVLRDASGNFSAGTITATLSGNASTATSADQIDGWPFSNTGSNLGVNADTLDSNGISYYTSGVPNFTGNATDGALYSQAYSANWQHQIAGDFRSGQIALRGKNSGTFQAWRTVLDSSNYTSYAPSLTGSGASGTWGINITGNAATITSQANSATITAATAATANQIVLRDSGGDDFRRYGFASYFNSSDEVSTGTISYIMAKFGDNYYRSATAAKVATFISGQSMNINGSSTSCSGNSSTATTASNLISAAGTIQTTTVGTSYSTSIQVREVSGGSSNTSSSYMPRLGWHWAGVVASSIGIETTGRMAIFNNPGTGYEALVCAAFTATSGTFSSTLSASNLSGTNTGDQTNISGSAATFTSTSQNSQFNSIGVGTAASGTAGEIRATNAVTAYYSDDRLKTKLGNIEGALAKVKTLSGFYYEANETAQALGYKPKREVGVSAQSVQAVLPEVVVPAPIDEQYLTVHYDKLIPLLIEAIKELEAKVALLEAKG